jgi:DNA polymerase III alpha subunit
MDTIKFSSCDCQVEKGKFDSNNISLDCAAVWALISSGFTTGVFQLETRLGQEWARKVKPSNIQELAALTALVRPGCLESGQSEEYVDIKFGRKQPNYLHPRLKDILGDTYGCLVYQEQAIKIATEVAGFSLENADELRKAMGKKKPELMAKLKIKFIDGCLKKGLVSTDTAKQIFGWIEKSQRYSFNKSHAISYGMLSYTTAWIKTHFPNEFFTSYLTFSNYKSDPKEEVYKLVQDARLFGIDVFPPDIRVRNVHFQMIDSGIKFGLSNIRGVGQSAISKIVEQSKESLSTWNEFLKSLPLIHRSVGIALIKSGACDCYQMERSQMVKELEILFGTSVRDKDGKNKEIRGLTDKERDWFFDKLFDGDDKTMRDVLTEMVEQASKMPGKSLSSMKKDDIIGWSKNILGETFDFSGMTKLDIINKLKENGYDESSSKSCVGPKRLKVIEGKLNQLAKDEIDTNLGKSTAEKYFLGISLSCSPSDDADDSAASHNCLDLIKALNGESFSVCAVIDSVKHTKTKKGKNPGAPMCFLTISDSSYSIDHAVVFPDTYEKIHGLCKDTLVCMIFGHKQNGSIIITDLRKLI